MTAGYGLPSQESFPAQLEAALEERDVRVTVLNHGVSGDTTAGGRQRLSWLLRDRPHVVLVELGANDALQGLSPQRMEENLDTILTELRSAGVVAVLAGMRAPRNLGPEYVDRFDEVYPRLAGKHDVPLYRFFLEGVVGDPRFTQADGIHPNARGVERIVQGILPMIESAVVSASTKR